MRYTDRHLVNHPRTSDVKHFETYRARDDHQNTVMAARISDDPVKMGTPVWLDRDAIKELVAEGQQFLTDTEPKLPTEPFSLIDVHEIGTPDGTWTRLVLLLDGATGRQFVTRGGERINRGAWDAWKPVES